MCVYGWVEVQMETVYVLSNAKKDGEDLFFSLSLKEHTHSLSFSFLYSFGTKY